MTKTILRNILTLPACRATVNPLIEKVQVKNTQVKINNKLVIFSQLMILMFEGRSSFFSDHTKAFLERVPAL